MRDCVYLFAWNIKKKYLIKKKTLKENGFHMSLFKNRIVFTGGLGDLRNLLNY